MNSYVSALSLDSSGHLYAGGQFTSAGGVTMNRMAKWNGSSWSALGSGMNNSVTAVGLDRSGHLFAAGDFTLAGDVSTSGVAKWNGPSWIAHFRPATSKRFLNDSFNSTYSPGRFDGEILASAVDAAGNIYVWGNFTSIGGVAANRIAMWNGTVWSPVGLGMNNTVTSLALGPDGTLYAGGTFTVAGVASAKYVAKWDGTAWSAVGAGTGFNTQVSDLVFGMDGHLYAGGAFTSHDAYGTMGYIARWNGSSWAPVGATTGKYGFNNVVYALAVGLDGTLYAGGGV